MTCSPTLLTALYIFVTVAHIGLLPTNTILDVSAVPISTERDPKLNLNSSTVDNLDLIYVIDESGSLRIKAYITMMNFVKNLTEKLFAIAQNEHNRQTKAMGFRLGLIGFHNNVNWNIALSQNVKLDELKNQIDDKIRKRRRMTNSTFERMMTQMKEGIKAAVQQFDRISRNRKRIILLLTDGKQTQTNNEKLPHFGEVIKRDSRKYNSSTRVFAIGFGEDIDKKYLKKNSDIFIPLENENVLERTKNLVISTVQDLVKDCVHETVNPPKVGCKPDVTLIGFQSVNGTVIAVTGDDKRCVTTHDHIVILKPGGVSNPECKNNTVQLPCDCPTETKHNISSISPKIKVKNNCTNTAEFRHTTQPSGLNTLDSDDSDKSHKTNRYNAGIHKSSDTELIAGLVGTTSKENPSNVAPKPENTDKCAEPGIVKAGKRDDKHDNNDNQRFPYWIIEVVGLLLLIILIILFAIVTIRRRRLEMLADEKGEEIGLATKEKASVERSIQLTLSVVSTVTPKKSTVVTKKTTTMKTSNPFRKPKAEQ